MNYIYSNRYQ